MKIKWDGTTYEGQTADEVIQAAKLDSFIIEDSIEGFREVITYRIETWSGEILHFTTSDEFLRELDRIGMIEILPEVAT